MSRRSELRAYYKEVCDIWVVSKFPRSFVDDLLPVLMDAGFIIDNVTVSYGGDDNPTWVGTCFDENLVEYQFMAVWSINMEKFTRSDLHYYELSELEIDPL